MKFTTFLKVFAIALASFVGAIGIGVGIMAIAGYFSKPTVLPADITFNLSEYNVDSDFSITISSTTQDVTETQLTLSLQNGEPYTENNGEVRISDGVISIPQTATIGEPFLVVLEKTMHDEECFGQDWITGGHSVITATSKNQRIDSISAKVNVDVPVYDVELETRVSATDDNSDTFAIGSTINASLKFYPARSAYQYSHDGSDGEVVYKNTYFTLLSNTDENISQNGHTNAFLTNRIGSSTIVGYVFSSASIEKEILLGLQNLDEEAQYSAILANLYQLSTDDTATTLRAHRTTKTVEIVNVEVDSMRIEGSVASVDIDKLNTLYVNKDVSQTATQSNLGIHLYSEIDRTVSLQHELDNVAIRFLYKVGNNYYDAVNSENDAYNIVSLPSYGYGNTKEVEIGGQVYTFYFPVITSSVDDYYWRFAVSNYVDANNLVIEARYFGNTASEVEPQTTYFSTNAITDAGIYWTSTSQTLTIIDGENPVMTSFDASDFAYVPQSNLYQTRRYFVVSSMQYQVTDLINTISNQPAEYQLGAQTVTLYEIDNGIIEPKSTEAYGHTFDILFMTVQTDYQANPKLDENGRYVIQRYSQDDLNAISTLQLYIDKTLYGLENHIQTALADDELTISEANDIAYVQNTTSPFEVVVEYTLPQSANQSDQINEQQIFKNAVINGDIYVVAKIEDSNTQTSLIYSVSYTEQNDGAQFVFSMNIGALSDGVSERRIKLYVVYENDALDQPIEYEVNTYNDGQTFECIEVYDGSATVFDFSVNIQEDGIYQSSADNRILVNTVITAENNYINNINTSYMVNGHDVSGMLFETSDLGEVDYSTLAITLHDKYGKLPISSNYTLESSNTSILTVSNNSFTFNGAGDVEVYLRDAEGTIKDTLYFSCEQDGYVSRVDKLVESAENPYTKSSVQEYSTDLSTVPYDFAQLSVQIVGYAGSIINLKSTTAGEVNLLTYYYSSNTQSGYLTNLMNIALVNEQDITTLEGYVNFGGTASNLSTISILKDFGKPFGLQLNITVAALGISQIVVLDIASNVSTALNPYDNNYDVEPISSVGNVIYSGVYADSLYHVRFMLNYHAGTGSENFLVDNSSYSLYLYEYDENGELGDRLLLTTTDTGANAYIESFESTDGEVTNNSVNRLDGSTFEYIYDAYIVFKSLNKDNGYRRVMLALEKNDLLTNASVDASSSLYLYINPNVMVTQSSDEILLDVAFDTINNTNRYYGSATLLGAQNAPLGISRIHNSDNVNFDIDYSQIGFKFVDDSYSHDYVIQRNGNQDEFIIYSLANIQNSATIKLIVTYNGVDVLTSDGKTYEITLTLRPNITRNQDSTMWVLYDGEYYLKFVNGEQYTSDEIIQAFTISQAQNSTAQISSKLNIENTNEITVQGDTITIQGVNNNLITGNTAQLVLSNGDSITFNILLLPFDLPYVIYPNQIAGQEYDLRDLLDIEWVMDNGLYYTISEYDTQGYNIFIDEQTQQYGLSGYLKNSILSVKNIDDSDLNIYAHFENGILFVEPVGGNGTFVIAEAKLNLANTSLVVPYLIKIEKMLDVHIYYPYMMTYSANGNITGTALHGDVKNVTYDMEYLSFDDSGNASADLLARFDSLIPNYQYNQRIVIGTLKDGTFIPQTELTPYSKLTFTISEVAYYFYDWFTATNVSQYAQVSSEGVVTIRRNGAQYVRVKVGMTTASGLEAYYYLSVGEIPTFTFVQRTQEGVSSTNIEDINLKAGDEGLLLEGMYSLSISFNASSGETSANNLLNYYIVATNIQGQNAYIDYDTMTLYADDTTENWNTNMVFYTKYGVLDVVRLYVLSNYKINIVETNTSGLVETTAGTYEIISGNIIDIANTFEIVKEDTGETFNDFDNIIVEIVTQNSALYYDDAAKSLNIGLVTEDTNVVTKIRFEFTDGTQNVAYNFDFNLKIKSTLKVSSTNNQQISQNNMLPVYGVKAGEIQNVDILSSLFDFAGDDFDAWYKNVVDNGLGRFNVELITQNVYGDFSGSVVLNENNHYVVQLNISEVANVTELSFRISYYNTVSSDDVLVMSSYFKFTLSSNFTIITNYPLPNDGVVSVAESYWFDSSENAQNIISLADVADLADNARVEVQSEDAEHEQHIYVQVGSGSEYVYVDGANVGNEYYALSTVFNIQGSEGLSVYDGLSLQFGLYYSLGDQSLDDKTYIPVGVYNVVVMNNIYGFAGFNYNTDSSNNNSNNPENIYIASNDDLLTKIRLTLTVPENADLSTTKYIRPIMINGVIAEADYVTMAEGSQGDQISLFATLTSLSVSDMTNFVSSDTGVQWEICELSQEGEYVPVIITDDTWNNIEVSFESRILLSYRTVTSFGDGASVTTQYNNIDFFKTYGLLSGTNCSLQQTTGEDALTQEQLIAKSIYVNSRNGQSVSNGTSIGTYYVNYGFDIEFESSENIELSAGQNTSVLHNGIGNNNANYVSLINMKRSSNGTYYVDSDFSSTGLSLNIEGTISYRATNPEYQNLITNTGYLRYTAAEGEGYNYDYNFMAYGSPKETSVTVELVLTVSYGSIIKDFTFTFVVSHDYENESLKNSDGTENSESNRNLIRDYNFVDYIIFAHWGSEEPIDNFIYIQHKNENQNQIGNVAPLFNVKYNQGGEYVLQFQQTEQNYDLAFKFTDIKYGNRNVDIVLTDAYGYKIVYYVTIVAQYNVTSSTSSLTPFELDSVALVDRGTTTNNYNHTIPITFTPRDSGIPDLKLTDFSSNWTAKFTTDSGEQLIKTDLISDSNSVYFNIDMIDYVYFVGGRLSGILSISAKDESGYQIDIQIPTTILERYSLTTTDTPYVRDGVPFSLLDVVDVVDNSQNYTVGERSLKDSHTIYFDYTILNSRNQKVYLDSVYNVLSLIIRAKNLQNNQVITETVPINSSSSVYISIEDIFDITDISNYQFQITYIVTNYEYENNELSEISTDEHSFSYYNGKTLTTYYLSSETSSGYKSVSQDATFYYTYREDAAVDVNEQYTIRINSSYIISDQSLSIGLRQMENNSQLNVYFVNEAGEVRNVSLDSNTNSRVTYSLRELGVINSARGEKVSLYTNGERTIINGLSVKQWAQLKGIEFESVSGSQDVVDTDTYSMTKYIPSDAEFLISNDGLNIKYAPSAINVKVNYGFVNGVAKKAVEKFSPEIWITLKYIDIDSTQAYGSEQAKDVVLNSYDPVNNNNISINVWAGTTYRPFTLVAGYTSATSFVASDDTTLSNNSGDFKYYLNTAQSTGSQYVVVDADTGEITLLPGFNLDTNYIMLDIYTIYGQARNNFEYIDTLRLYFSDANSATYSIVVNVPMLPRIQDGASNTYKILTNDIVQMLNISDGKSNVYTGDDIKYRFPNTTIDIYDSANQDLSLGVINLGLGNDSITFNNDVSNVYLIVKLQGDNDTGVRIDNITLVDSRYTANSLVSSSMYESISSGDEGAVFEMLLPKIKLRNIYGNIDSGAKIFDLESESGSYNYLVGSKNVVYSKVTNGIVTTFTYTIGNNLSQNDDTISGTVYGTITVNTYASTDKIIGESSLIMQAGQSTTNFVNNNLIDFSDVKVFGYNEVQTFVDDESQESQTTKFIYISTVDDIDDYPFSSISTNPSATFYINGKSNNGLNLEFVSDGILITSMDFSAYNNKIISLVIEYGIDSNRQEFKFSFLYKDEQEGLTINVTEGDDITYTSTRIKDENYTNIFTLLSNMYSVSVDDIFISATCDDQNVLLINDNGNYSLMLLASDSSNDSSGDSSSDITEINVIIKFYIAIYDNLSSTETPQQEIVLYTNTITINV